MDHSYFDTHYNFNGDLPKPIYKGCNITSFLPWQEDVTVPGINI